MISALSHNASKPSSSNIVSSVQRSLFVVSVDIASPHRLVVVPINFLGRLSIKLVHRVVNSAKIAQSVIAFVMVDVVNHFWLTTIRQKPCQPVAKVFPVVVGNSNVATFVDAPGNASRLDASASIDKPDQISRFRIVAQDIMDTFRDTFASHIKPPFDVVRGLTVVAVSLPILLSGCSTAKGNARAAQHAADQVRMVAVQREARVKEKQAEAAQKTALVEALARVAEANPEQAASVTVALAVIGARGADDANSDPPTVTLQKEQNVGLEYVKALAPTVGNLVSGLGVAAINAGVQRNASDNNRDILLGDQAADRGIVEAVAGVGIAAANNSGLSVNGDNYTLSDSASISQDQVSNVAETTTTTTTTTETNTSSEIADSYNTVTYEGQDFSLPNLLAYLQGTGLAYNLTIGDTVYTVDGDGDPVTIDCGAPDFSPSPPECI